MKKNLKIVGIISIFILVIICIVFFNIHRSEKGKNSVSFMKRMFVIEKGDGWFYSFQTNKIDGVNEVKNFFAGCNIKYEKLDNYNILVYDTDYNIIGRIPDLPQLSLSEYSTDGVTEREEVQIIDDYFNKKQFNRKINSDDLQDLTLYNFNQFELIELYNGVQELEYLPQLGNIQLPECNIANKDFDEQKKIQIGTIVSSDIFKAVWIDIKYNDNKYLSDLVATNKANADEIKLYQNLKSIERYIVENNDVKKLSKNFSNYNDQIYLDLFDLADSLLEKRW